MKTNLLIIFFLLYGICSAQTVPKDYFEYTKQADSLYNIKEYRKAALLTPKPSRQLEVKVKLKTDTVRLPVGHCRTIQIAPFSNYIE